MNEARAKKMMVRVSHRKLKLLMTELRGKPYSTAIAYLSFSPKMVGFELKKIRTATGRTGQVQGRYVKNHHSETGGMM